MVTISGLIGLYLSLVSVMNNIYVNFSKVSTYVFLFQFLQKVNNETSTNGMKFDGYELLSKKKGTICSIRSCNNSSSVQMN